VASSSNPDSSSPNTIPFSREPSSQLLSRAAKLLLDLTGAVSLLLVLSPLLAAITVLIKLDGGPVFYAHPRVGAGKRRFRCFKFRSMRQDSAAMLEHLLRTDAAAASE